MTPGDVRTLASGRAYLETPSAAFGAPALVRADKDHRKAAKKPGAILSTPADTTGLVETGNGTCNSGRVPGLTAGTCGELPTQVPTQVRDLADLVACELSAGRLTLFDIAKNESKDIYTKRGRCSLGLAAQRG